MPVWESVRACMCACMLFQKGKNNIKITLGLAIQSIIFSLFLVLPLVNINVSYKESYSSVPFAHSVVVVAHNNMNRQHNDTDETRKTDGSIGIVYSWSLM